MLGWILLAMAVCLEATATFAAKYANGFTNFIPSVVTIVAFGLSFVALTFSLNTIEMSVAYPVWTGCAVSLVAVLGIVVFNEELNFFKVFSTLLVVFGIVGLVMSSRPDLATCETNQPQAFRPVPQPKLATMPVFNRGILPVLASPGSLYRPNVISLKPEFSERG
jgi:multidrug transporter EmrE-like cation transporter